MDRDPAGLDGLLELPLGLYTGLSGLERDRCRPNGELGTQEGLEGLDPGKEPVDTRFCCLLLNGMSTPPQ